MSLERRGFLKIAALSSATLLTGKAYASSAGDAHDYKESYGVLVDTTVCIGCRKCEWACNQQNELTKRDRLSFEDKTVFASHRRPDAKAYTVVNQFQDPQRPEKQNYMKVQCLHCNRPACASACIVGALKKTSSGPVVYDPWKCIGCRYCMVACPFQVPAYEYDNALTPRVMKCSFCYTRLAEGKKPACAEICPNDALTFGKREELVEVAYTRMRSKPEAYYNHLYGETEIGGTSWMYICSTDFVNTELPKLESKAMPDYTEPIQHGIFKSFVPPLAWYGLLGLAMYSLKDKDQHEEDHK